MLAGWVPPVISRGCWLLLCVGLLLCAGLLLCTGLLLCARLLPLLVLGRAEVGVLLLVLLLLELMLLLELDVLLPLELELLLTDVAVLGSPFLCFLPLLMLLTLQVLPVSPIRGTNKSPTTTKTFLHGAYIKTKQKGATAHNLTRLLSTRKEGVTGAQSTKPSGGGGSRALDPPTRLKTNPPGLPPVQVNSYKHSLAAGSHLNSSKWKTPPSTMPFTIANQWPM